jgi:NAD(P)-dependent dehydrogenase (short-subunit alcohol dehydrogenase family)
MRDNYAVNTKTAVVTGAASGLGRAFCEELAARGAAVVAADIDVEGARATARSLAERGGKAVAIACDVSDAAQVESLAEAAREALGPIDLVVNNAGVAVAGPLDSISLEDWQWIMGINLWGVIHGCRSFAPAMKARGRGAIINIASAAGFLCAPDMAPYNVTKAGVIALSETLHAELLPAGVHVSVVCPTFFKTGILDASRGPVDERTRALAAKLMSRSAIQAGHVARAALDAAARNQLYVVPMTDGKVMWRLKRLQPERFYQLAGSKLARRLFGP